MKIVDDLGDLVGIFKVGLELLNAAGIEIIKSIADTGGKIFLDGKFNDIPNTVAGACRAVLGRPISMFTIHSLGGLEMMRAAVEAVSQQKGSKSKRPLVLAVTILTSIDNLAMNEQLRIPGRIHSQVFHLASLAMNAGVDGIIASPQETQAIRTISPNDFLIVTPGVRPIWADLNDQKRVMTPSEAIMEGASLLVIGRPILKPPSSIGSSREAAMRIADEIEDALSRRAR